jgi:hypothetical protein
MILKVNDMLDGDGKMVVVWPRNFVALRIQCNVLKKVEYLIVIRD